MKTIQYIISSLIILSFSFLVSSCSDEEINNGTPGDGEHVQISLSVPKKAVVSPLTKSATQAESNVVSSLYILVYDNNQLQNDESKFYSTDTDGKLKSLSDGNTVNYSLNIKTGSREIYLIANADQDGALLENGTVSTIDALEKVSFDLSDNSPQLVMFAGPYGCNPQSNASIDAQLERIYSMVTVRIEKKLSDGIDIFPISLQIKNIPDKGRLISPNKIKENGVGCFEDGSIIKDDRGIDLSKEHDSASPFYLYENMQPNGKNIEKKDQTKKTPSDYDLDTPEEIVKLDKKCSYIEVKAKYVKNGNSQGAGSGTIIYRFFLGEDAYNNFEVKRNAWYKITLTLNGNGGKDENTWRVDTDLLDDVTIDDLYVGYRVNSESKLVINGKVGENFSITNVTSDDKINGDERFLYEVRDGKYYVKAKYTNTHDFDKKPGKIHYKSGGVEKTANVYQVPRLVDPIAVYKHSSNNVTTEIVVKEYIPKKNGAVQNGYYTLVSQGAWSATTESDWITLSTTSDGGEMKYIESGEGENDNKVIFYMHNGTSSGAPRYGKITVMYHNKNCKHEIFVRQGGYDTDSKDDTKIGNTAWSIFNCIGMNNDGVKGITTSPTQTGWFFHGGYNEAMNPYRPGYAKNSSPEWSVSSSVYHNDRNVSWTKDGKDGPCPIGYKVATIDDYYDLIKKTEIYLGFVHDDMDEHGNYNRNSTDDKPVGWYYNGKDMVAKENNYCNPAKGTLFVSNDDDTNVFFTYGKGVLERNDKDYINEIGVGYRGAYRENFVLSYNYGNVMTPNASYGAIYYTSTPGSAAGNYWGKADFGYNFEGVKYQYLLDNPDNAGLQGQAHGCFVRCVRDESSQPSKKKTVKIEAEFKYKKNQGDSKFKKIEEGVISVYDETGKNKLTEFTTDKDGEFEGKIELPSDIEFIQFSYAGIFLPVNVHDLNKEKIYYFSNN